MQTLGDMRTAGPDKDLLDLLCCPSTHQPLRLARPEELGRINADLDHPLSAGLVREDGRILYPVREGIPLLIPEEGLQLT